jgi:hypothetical protein
LTSWYGNFGRILAVASGDKFLDKSAQFLQGFQRTERLNRCASRFGFRLAHPARDLAAGSIRQVADIEVSSLTVSGKRRCPQLLPIQRVERIINSYKIGNVGLM